MGLDVKEKNLLRFVCGTLLPPAVALPLLSRFLFPGDFLGFVGFVFLSYAFHRSVLSPAWFHLKTRVLRRTDVRGYGDWAIVTGATSGIGMEFTHTFGKLGLNVLVVSRSVPKMEALKKDFEERHGKKLKYVQYDFNNTDPAVLASFKASFASALDSVRSAGILVNNVGLSNENPEYVHLIPQDEVDQMLNVNNGGTVLMSRLVLPDMVRRRKGAIITVSSASCTHPTALLSVYSATKGFGNQLTRSMHYEYKEFGIDCLSITPYYFVSNMFKRRKGTYLAPLPSSIVEPALLSLGHAPEAYPYWGHYLMGVIGHYYWDTANGLLGIMKRSKARAEAKAKMKAEEDKRK